MEDLKKDLLERIECFNPEEISKFKVVLLPDFFVDHFIMMNNFEKEISKFKEIFEQGGGNIPNIPQLIHQGGNAANTALTLAKLGVNAHLICRTNEFGLHLLKFFLQKHGVNIDNVKTDGKLAVTSALEFGDEHVNIMIGDTGSVSDFAFEHLNENDLEKISNSNITAVMNWTLNKNGTDLARNVFNYAKKHNVKTYFDTGDPCHRKNDIPRLMNQVLTDRNLDILGINENELHHYSESNDMEKNEDIIKSAISLKEKINARLDLHTSDFSCSIKNEQTIVPALKFHNIFRSTGAGDAWNAGNIFGELLDFRDDERLLFANIIAGFYISSSEPIHPNLEQIIDFTKKIS